MPRRSGPAGAAVALGLWALFGLGPVLALGLELVTGLPDLPPEAPGPALGRRAALLLRSVALGAAVAGVCVVVGGAAALRLHAARGGAARRLAWAAMILLVLPPYVHATAWMQAGAALDGALAPLGLAAPALPGWLRTVWVQSMAFLPLALALALAGLAMVDRRQVEAARVFAGPWATFSHVVLPQAAPALGVGAGLVFVLAVTDYSVPTLMQVPTYALESFVEYSIAADGAVAVAVGLPLAAVCLAAVAAVAGAVRRIATVPEPDGPAPALGIVQGPGGRTVTGAALAVVAVQVGVPVAVLVGEGIGPGAARTLAAASGALGDSLAIAAATAALSVGMALLLAPRLDRPAWLVLVLVPLAVPGSLVGIGLVELWNRPGFGTIYGSPAMPVLAAAARFAPVAVLLVHAQISRTDPRLIEAAELYRGPGWATGLQVVAPLRAPGLAAAFFAVFALSLAELSATVVVAPPGVQTLTLRIYGLLHYGATQQVTALCLMALALSATAMAVALLAMSRWRAAA